MLILTYIVNLGGFMKYCAHCGNQLFDDAVICVKCGCKTEDASNKNQTLRTVAKVFMIISTVFWGIYLIPLCFWAFIVHFPEEAVFWGIYSIPLCWCIPMTIHYSNAIKEKNRSVLALKFALYYL